MLQQTQVKTVVPYWTRWMQALPTVRALARASSDQVLKLWEGLGYYRRADHLRRAAKMIVSRFAGVLPQDPAAWRTLPGVGPYTAGAICSIAFNQPTPVLDGNVMRVLARVFGISGDPRTRSASRRLWSLATQLVEGASAIERNGERNCAALNQALMELGAMVCAPRQPRCGQCPLRAHCVARRTNRVREFPGGRGRVSTTARRFAAFVIERRGRFLVRQRPQGVLNARLWEFPNVELNGRRPGLGRAAAVLLDGKPAALRRVAQITHTITRHRITVEVCRVELSDQQKQLACGGLWRTARQLQRLAFPSAHRKILRLVASGAG